jgi:endonuclease/exonuclease/phosphatase family metal-dependent hydrolase
MHWLMTLSFSFVLFFAAAAIATPPLRVLAWNVQSRGADAEVIAEQLKRMEPYHIYALSEVSRKDLTRFTDAIGHRQSGLFHHVNSSTGGRALRLEIIFDTRRLQLIETREIFAVRQTLVNDEMWDHRSPLVAKFRDRETKQSFLVVLNHLARGDAELRTRQAKGLREWAEMIKLPVIAVGDYNFDYDFPTAKGNAGFDEMLKGDVWKWVRPMKLIDTNWADHDEDGKDDYPDSMLDFVFVSGAAKKWAAECRVITRRGDFPDDESTSDHRPVQLVITPREVGDGE